MFLRVIKTRMEVWENENSCWNTTRQRVFPQLFRLLPFHECFYNSIETQNTFPIFHKPTKLCQENELLTWTHLISTVLMPLTWPFSSPMNSWTQMKNVEVCEKNVRPRLGGMKVRDITRSKLVLQTTGAHTLLMMLKTRGSSPYLTAAWD